MKVISILVLLTSFALTPGDNNGILQLRYDGRTPCQELGAMLTDHVPAECWKAKWSLTLNWAPGTHEPATFEMKGFLRETKYPFAGTWKITKGTAIDPQAIVYELTGDINNAGRMMQLQKIDDVLFFMSKDRKLMVGDYNCSYTLNLIDKK